MSILSNKKPAIISSYLIEEEEEDKELVGEERDIEALAKRKDPLCNQNINSLFKVSESVHMNGDRWIVRDQGYYPV